MNEPLLASPFWNAENIQMGPIPYLIRTQEFFSRLDFIERARHRLEYGEIGGQVLVASLAPRLTCSVVVELVGPLSGGPAPEAFGRVTRIFCERVRKDANRFDETQLHGWNKLLDTPLMLISMMHSSCRSCTQLSKNKITKAYMRFCSFFMASQSGREPPRGEKVLSPGGLPRQAHFFATSP